ncbi:MAG TPA: site-2 protease family protein [Gemmatimonadales bacterium]
MSLTRFLLAWRTIPLRDREVVDALVDPAHARPSPALAEVLRAWPGTHYWSDEADGRHLIFARRTAAPAPEAWTLHALLFAATLFTTTLAGAIIAGAIPADPRLILNPGEWGPAFFRAWTAGLSFSLPLLAILLCHELGHYLTARRYQLDVSPPYFIPAPPFFFWIGTLGAFIRLRTILTDRRQLIDVGAAGPIAGFVVALPILWIGLAHSEPLAVEEGARGTMFWWFGGSPGPALGDSLVTLLVRRLAAPGVAAVMMHPMAFAGWLGMFVTTLNLLPIAQLDGGHILFAALPRWRERVARGFWIGLMLLGWFWIGWLVWGAVVLALSRGRLGHPPVLDAYRPLPASRRRLAWASLALFLVTFAPVPFGT